MKRVIIGIIVTLLSASAYSQSFLDGFLRGLVQGIGNAAQRQSYDNARHVAPIQETYKIEEDGFEWIKIERDDIVGAKSVTGSSIIPLSKGCDMCYYKAVDSGFAYFVIRKQNKEGVCSISGKDIIPFSRGYTWVGFLPETGHVGYFGVEKNGKEGVCDIYGREIIPCIYDNLIFSSDFFKYKDALGNWVEMEVTLDSQGNGINLAAESTSKKSTQKKTERRKCPNPYCSGPGNSICVYCHGTGYFDFVFDLDAPAVPVPIESGTSTFIGNNNSVTEINESATPTRTKCGNCVDGLEKYMPWLGSAPDTYCDICKKSGYPHSHRPCTICNGTGWR